MTFLISAGERSEQVYFSPLMEQGAIKRHGRGRPRLRPKRVAADKGYSTGIIRRYLRQRGIGIVIPTTKNQRRAARFDRVAYRQRNIVERAFNRLKQFRRIATRYEKCARYYLAMLTIATFFLWL